MKITAIIPTRGDVDCSPITRALRNYPEIGEILLVASDTPFNRYVWAARAETELIYTQDDDCLTDIRPLIDAWPATPRTSGCFINAMTREHAAQYPGAQTLIGFGCLFQRGLEDRTFIRPHAWQRDALFYRESDRIFATVNPHVTEYPAIQILSHASAPNRWWRQPDHLASREAMNKRIFEVTGIKAGCL